MDRLERLLNLVIALRETYRPMTAAEVRERVAGYGQADLAAFRRMFARDKADLRALGVPLETVPLDAVADEVGYRIDRRRYDLPPVHLDDAELAALALAVQAAGMADEATTSLLKLGVDAGEPAPPPAERPPVGVSLDAPHLGELAAAQLTRTPMRFRYRPAVGEETTRIVDPHALVHRAGRWYLVGHDHGRQARRAFRLDRIAGGVEPAGPAGTFVVPEEDVGVDDVVPPPPGQPGTAEVAAAPSVAWQVAARARGGGRPRADGWTIFDVPFRDPDELVAWVLAHGPELELVAPPDLRAGLLARLDAVLDATAGAA